MTDFERRDLLQSQIPHCPNMHTYLLPLDMFHLDKEQGLYRWAETHWFEAHPRNQMFLFQNKYRCSLLLDKCHQGRAQDLSQWVDRNWLRTCRQTQMFLFRGTCRHFLRLSMCLQDKDVAMCRQSLCRFRQRSLLLEYIRQQVFCKRHRLEEMPRRNPRQFRLRDL